MINKSWRKSSRSLGNGYCVEVRLDALPGGVEIRDSKNPTGPSITIDQAAWMSFIREFAKGGQPL